MDYKSFEYMRKILPNEFNWSILYQLFKEDEIELSETAETYLRTTPWNTNLTVFEEILDETSDGGDSSADVVTFPLTLKANVSRQFEEGLDGEYFLYTGGGEINKSWEENLDTVYITVHDANGTLITGSPFIYNRATDADTMNEWYVGVTYGSTTPVVYGCCDFKTPNTMQYEEGEWTFVVDKA